MLEISDITKDSKQDFDITLEDRTRLTLQMRYRPSQQHWYATFIYDGRTLDVLLKIGVNLIDVWENFVDFGVVCFSPYGADPSNVTDFIPTERRPAPFEIWVGSKAEISEVIYHP